MTVQPSEDLELELRDPEFAAYYGADQAKLQLAFSLVNARGKIGLTQKQVAEKLDVSQPYVAKLEKGDANPTIGRIGSMLALLGLRLLADTEPLSPEPASPFALYVQPSAVCQFGLLAGEAAGIVFDTNVFLHPAAEGSVPSAAATPLSVYIPGSGATGDRPEPVAAGGGVTR